VDLNLKIKENKRKKKKELSNRIKKFLLMDPSRGE